MTTPTSPVTLSREEERERIVAAFLCAIEGRDSNPAHESTSEAIDTAHAEDARNIIRALDASRAAEAQDTAASSGLRERIVDGIRAIAETSEDGASRALAESLLAALAQPTPEPELRDALAAALHNATPVEQDGGVPDVCNRYPEHEALADAIIAALPGLSLSAQPGETGETP